MIQHLVDAVVGGIIGLVLADSAPKIDKCLYLRHPEYVYIETPVASLPPCADGQSRILIVSDTHDTHVRIESLPDCDTLIHCGDVMMTSKYFSHAVSLRKLQDFNVWLGTCNAKQRLVIGGNHDNYLERIGPEAVQSVLTNAQYLLNDHCKVGQLSAWATPLSIGKSPNRAFQRAEFRKKTMESKPAKVDVLITHGQCEELTSAVEHKIHIWGHAHNSYGVRYPGDKLRSRYKEYNDNALSICVPLMDGRFRMRNLPVVIDLPNNSRELDSIPTAEDIRDHKFSYQPSAASVKMKSAIATAAGADKVRDKPAPAPAVAVRVGWMGLCRPGYSQAQVVPSSQYDE
jgi:predicted phosphodiesterase